MVKGSGGVIRTALWLRLEASWFEDLRVVASLGDSVHDVFQRSPGVLGNSPGTCFRGQALGPWAFQEFVSM